MNIIRNTKKFPPPTRPMEMFYNHFQNNSKVLEDFCDYFIIPSKIKIPAKHVKHVICGDFGLPFRNKRDFSENGKEKDSRISTEAFLAAGHSPLVEVT